LGLRGVITRPISSIAHFFSLNSILSAPHSSSLNSLLRILDLRKPRGQ